MSRTRLNDDFARQVLSVVEKIPAGSVATYGQLACLIGRPKNARLVARVLSHAEYYGHFPCHRVVNHAGRIAPGWSEQADRSARKARPSRMKRMSICGNRSGCARTKKNSRKGACTGTLGVRCTHLFQQSYRPLCMVVQTSAMSLLYLVRMAISV